VRACRALKSGDFNASGDVRCLGHFEKRVFEMRSEHQALSVRCAAFEINMGCEDACHWPEIAHGGDTGDGK